MIYIFDDTFRKEELEAVQCWAENLSTRSKWFLMSDLSFAKQLVDLAANYFDLSTIIGCEMHINYKTPVAHLDKDEAVYESKNILLHPLCSIVYYTKIEMKGGNLVFPKEEVIVTPRTNRTVIFRSDLLHTGMPSWGIRQSVGINPWNRVPLDYQNVDLDTKD